jgi:putative effector of murein hydrolase
MLYWQVHLIVSNIDWRITAVGHILSVVYHMTAFIVRDQPGEPLHRQTSFIALLLLINILYICLSYFSDSQKKTNFVNEALLIKVITLLVPNNLERGEHEEDTRVCFILMIVSMRKEKKKHRKA